METFIFIIMVISLVVNIVLFFMVNFINQILQKYDLSIRELAEEEVISISERKAVIMKMIKDNKDKIKSNQEKIDELNKQIHHSTLEKEIK